MRFIKRTTFLLGMLVATGGFAAPQTNFTLNMTLVNNTDTSLTYAGVTQANPGNVFTVTPSPIPAHGTAMVVGVIQKDFDLAGLLHFKDDSGYDNVLLLLDPRQFHFTDPAFEISNGNNITAKLVSKTYNPHIAARDLLLTEVTVNMDPANLK